MRIFEINWRIAFSKQNLDKTNYQVIILRINISYKIFRSQQCLYKYAEGPLHNDLQSHH